MDLFKACSKPDDPYVGLPDLLSEGIHLGLGDPILPFGIWIPQHLQANDESAEVAQLDANWNSAKDDAGSVTEIIDANIAKVRMQVIPGGLAEADRRMGHKVAVGKLGLVQLLGNQGRLIGDSTICGVTARIRILERIYHPGPADVDAAVQNPSLPQKVAGLSIDVEAAHNMIKVIPANHGLLLFLVPDKRLVGFTVCHFGGRSTAYLLARIGALLVRLGHKVLFVAHVFVFTSMTSSGS